VRARCRKTGWVSGKTSAVRNKAAEKTYNFVVGCLAFYPLCGWLSIQSKSRDFFLIKKADEQNQSNFTMVPSWNDTITRWYRRVVVPSWVISSWMVPSWVISPHGDIIHDGTVVWWYHPRWYHHTMVPSWVVSSTMASCTMISPCGGIIMDGYHPR